MASRGQAKLCRVSTTRAFGDLLWDPDMTGAEANALDAAVIVDASLNRKRIVVQVVREEIRYWMAEGDDITTGQLDRYELGTLESLDAAAGLITEFVANHSGLPTLSSDRRVLRRCEVK
jgi:hypothetical protein